MPPVPDYIWHGDTDDLLRRLGLPPKAQQIVWERSLWFAIGSAVALAFAGLLTSRAPEPAGLHVVRTGEDRIMWVSERRAKVGGCVLDQDRIRCVKTDWMSGPLDLDRWSLDEEP